MLFSRFRIVAVLTFIAVPALAREFAYPLPPLSRPARGTEAVALREKTNEQMSVLQTRMMAELKSRVFDNRPTTQPAPREPRTFYVDARDGADNADGATPATAWRSTRNLSRTAFVPGDRVRFRAGTTVTGGRIGISACGAPIEGAAAGATPSAIDADLPVSRGDAAKPIVFESYGGAHGQRATIDSGNEPGFYAGCLGGITLRNLRFKGSRPNDGLRPTPPMRGPVGHNGILFWAPRASFDVYRGIRVRNVEVSNYWHSGILLSTRPLDGRDNAVGYRDVEIDRAHLHHNLRSGFETWGSDGRESFADLRVRRSRVHHHPGSTHHDLDSITSGSGIVIGYAARVRIEDNVVHHNTTGCIAGCGFGIWTWVAHDVVIQRNESYANRAARLDGGGIDLDGGTHRALVQHNFTHDNGGAGILICNFDGAQVGDLTVRFNISQNDGQVNPGGAGLTVLTQNWDAGSNPRAPKWGSGSLRIYRNTFYSGARFGSPKPGIGALGFDPIYNGVVGVFADNPRDIEFRQNIFYADNDLPHIATQWRGQGAPHFLGNAYAGRGAALITWDLRDHRGLAAWRAATGDSQESNGWGAEGDPRWLRVDDVSAVNNVRRMRAPGGPLAVYAGSSRSPLVDPWESWSTDRDDARLFDWGLSLAAATDFLGAPAKRGATEDIGAIESAE